MPFTEEWNAETGGLLFRRTPTGFYVSLALLLAGLVFTLLGLLLRGPLVWLELGFSLFLLAVAIVHYLRYLGLPQIMYFSKQRRALVVGRRDEYAYLPYSEIDGPAIETMQQGGTTLHFLVLRLRAGGHWLLQAFGARADEAAERLTQVQAQLQQAPSTSEPDYPMVRSQDYWQWRSRDLAAYLQMLLFLLPLLWLVGTHWLRLSVPERWFVSAFLAFAFGVGLFKVLLAWQSYRFVRFLPTGIEYGRIRWRQPVRLRCLEASASPRLVLNFFPAATAPALSTHILVLDPKVYPAHQPLEFRWLRRSLQLRRTPGLWFIDVQSLSYAQRVELYLAMRAHLAHLAPTSLT